MVDREPGAGEAEEARMLLMELARALGRAAAEAAHRQGLNFDIDDPEVARDLMQATFDGLFLRPGRARNKRNRGSSTS